MEQPVRRMGCEEEIKKRKAVKSESFFYVRHPVLQSCGARPASRKHGLVSGKIVSYRTIRYHEKVKIEVFLRQSPLAEVTRVARNVERHVGRIFQTEGLHLLEALVLVTAFFEAPAPVKPSRLAETLSTSRGNVSHCVSALETKGFIERRIDPDDARSFYLVLRPQGKKCAMQVIRTFDRMQKEFEKQIGTAELCEALDVIKRIEQICATAAGSI
jgi:DNA-binding MarR family transcriptional regulator